MSKASLNLEPLAEVSECYLCIMTNTRRHHKAKSTVRIEKRLDKKQTTGTAKA